MGFISSFITIAVLTLYAFHIKSFKVILYSSASFLSISSKPFCSVCQYTKKKPTKNSWYMDKQKVGTLKQLYLYSECTTLTSLKYYLNSCLLCLQCCRVSQHIIVRFPYYTIFPQDSALANTFSRKYLIKIKTLSLTNHLINMEIPYQTGSAGKAILT